jgi:hypothetical protein
MSDADRNAMTIVLQSHNHAALGAWQGLCCASVEAWAHRRGFAYRREGDELFQRADPDLQRRWREQPVVLSDLARLEWLASVLDEGYERAVWVDADVLVFRDFTLADAGDRVGRECWLEWRGRRLRSFRKVHNAWLQFGRGSVFLPFYIDRARALLTRAVPPVVPQFIGPKLLTAWHNIAPFAVEERVGMLSPAVMAEALDPGPGNAAARSALRAGHGEELCALNLCGSYEGRSGEGADLTAEGYEALIALLVDTHGGVLQP